MNYFKDIPNGNLERRAYLFSESIQDMLSGSISFANERYRQAEFLQECIYFVQDDLFDTGRSDLNSLNRLWFFPISESHDELELALLASLMGMYKSVYDHLRRALEITVVGAYFLMSHVSEDEAKAWLRSDAETPPFSRAVRGLMLNERFAELEKASGWCSRLKKWYWWLSDAIHVRGSGYSLQAMQPSSFIFNGIRALEYSEKHLSRCLDRYIYTVRHIAVCRAAENPILLVGLPLEDKFGINPPMSGFFEPHQSDILWRVLLSSTLQYFKDLIQKDEEVLAVQEWCNNLPDMSKDELRAQIEEHERNLKMLNKRLQPIADKAGSG